MACLPDMGVGWSDGCEVEGLNPGDPWDTHAEDHRDHDRDLAGVNSLGGSSAGSQGPGDHVGVHSCLGIPEVLDPCPLEVCSLDNNYLGVLAAFGGVDHTVGALTVCSCLQNWVTSLQGLVVVGNSAVQAPF